MCIGIAMVIKEGIFIPFYINGNNSHNDIRKKFHLTDIDFETLPIEFHCNGCLTNWEDWEYHVDINHELPQWYNRASVQYKATCTEVLKQIIEKINETGIYIGDLNLIGTQIKSVGNLQQCGDLDLRGTPITSLGNLQQCEDLNLSNTLVTSLGNLQQCDDLDLRGTPITSLGNLQQCDDLDLSNTLVTSLGNLQQCDDLDLRGTSITSLGNLQICGDIDLEDTQIASLGNLQQCGDLCLRGTLIVSLENLRQLQEHKLQVLVIYNNAGTFILEAHKL